MCMDSSVPGLPFPIERQLILNSERETADDSLTNTIHATLCGDKHTLIKKDSGF